jgi:hypothetical protein
VLANANGKEAKVNRRHDRQGYRKESYHQQLLEAIGQFLPQRGLPLQVDRVRICWVPRMLVIAAVLMVWAPGKSLQDRFAKARDTLVGLYKSRKRPGRSYQGFIRALARQSAGLLEGVCRALQKGVERVARQAWRVEGWLVFGVDGSRIDCPMTAANEAFFGCAGKNKTGPQQLVTTLIHVGSGLIWGWRRGDSASSERGHLREMLDLLPTGSLLLADAGYTGYDLLEALRQRKIDFVIRVGANVRLLEKLGYAVTEHEGIVYLWPSRQQKKGMAPLVLRLIVLTDERNRTMYLLSSVLQEDRLSDAAAGRLYRRRWDVELLYRALKQTLERRKMLSDSPGHAQVELDWTMAGLWLLGLLGLQAIQTQGQSLDRWSVAGTLRVIQRAMDKGYARCRRGGLRQSLGVCWKDGYRRGSNKRARHRKNKKTERPPGAPKLRMADESEILLAQGLPERKHAA